MEDLATGRDICQHDPLPRDWGIRCLAAGLWSFALWAPSSAPLELELDGQRLPMTRGADGVHRCIAEAPEGAGYRFRLGDLALADPASLQQQGGVDGPSILRSLAGLTFRPGRPAPGRFGRQVILELHVGTFTAEGTFAAAARSAELRRIAALGITAIQLMPVGQYAGQRGWGCDPDLPWAPHDGYGTPEDLAGLVDAAHRLGLLVYLDLVVSHFGPAGSKLRRICPEFFRDDLGAGACRIAGERPQVRGYLAGCALHWLQTYQVDGLRIDASRAPEDTITAADLAGPLRQAVPQAHLVCRGRGPQVRTGSPGQRLFDAQLDDNHHHALHILLTGGRCGPGAPVAEQPMQDLVRALGDGLDAADAPQDDMPPSAVVKFNLNHHAARNRPGGDRLVSLAGPEVAQVAHALLLTAPHVPLLFMGEEVGSRSPFPWFADHGSAIVQGPSCSPMPGRHDPLDPETARLAWPYGEAAPDSQVWLALTRSLLDLRRRDLMPVFASGRTRPATVVITGTRALVADWHFRAGTLRSAVAFTRTPRRAAEAAAPMRSGARKLAAVGDDGGPWFRMWICSDNRDRQPPRTAHRPLLA